MAWPRHAIRFNAFDKFSTFFSVCLVLVGVMTASMHYDNQPDHTPVSSPMTLTIYVASNIGTHDWTLLH